MSEDVVRQGFTQNRKKLTGASRQSRRLFLFTHHSSLITHHSSLLSILRYADVTNPPAPAQLVRGLNLRASADADTHVQPGR